MSLLCVTASPGIIISMRSISGAVAAFSGLLSRLRRRLSRASSVAPLERHLINQTSARGATTRSLRVCPQAFCCGCDFVRRFPHALDVRGTIESVLTMDRNATSVVESIYNQPVPAMISHGMMSVGMHYLSTGKSICLDQKPALGQLSHGIQLLLPYLLVVLKIECSREKSGASERRFILSQVKTLCLDLGSGFHVLTCFV